MIVSVQMTVVHDVNQFKLKNVIPNEEVIAFNFSPLLYPTKQFSPYQTTFVVNGYSVFLFYKEGRGFVVA